MLGPWGLELWCSNINVVGDQHHKVRTSRDYGSKQCQDELNVNCVCPEHCLHICDWEYVTIPKGYSVVSTEMVQGVRPEVVIYCRLFKSTV